jgi:hypothetical protein
MSRVYVRFSEDTEVGRKIMFEPDGPGLSLLARYPIDEILRSSVEQAKARQLGQDDQESDDGIFRMDPR